jgi:hypothetical protein
MADQQPGDEKPAAGEPDETRAAAGEPTTADAPARWSGSAAVPQPGPKKSRNSRRAARLARENAAEVPAEEHEPTAVDPYDWASMPPVDPWADQDTPWDPYLLDPAPEPPLPPTRVDRPAPTRIEGASVPPPAAPAPTGPPPPAPSAPAPAGPPPSAPGPAGASAAAQRPAPPEPPKPSRWGRKPKRAKQTQPAPPKATQPVNRVSRPPSAGDQSRGLPPAPPWIQRPPQRPLPPPRRRRRHWGRRLSLFSLFGLLCCCGLPLAYFTVPAARQYPVNAVLPDSFLDLNKRNDDTSKEAAARLAREMRDAGGRAGDTFAGIYGDGNGKRVTVFGVTGWRLDPGHDVSSELDRLSDEFSLDDVQSFDAGEFGVHEECGVGRSNGNAVVVCAWADHGSLATVLLTRRSLDESAQLVEQLRTAVLTPGIAKPPAGIPKL